MTRYILRRLLQFIPVILIATFIVYAMVFAIPGDPIRALAGERPLSETVQQTLRDQYNLDDPLFIQYVKYMAGVAVGDFGTTFQGRPVTDIIVQRLPVTLYLTAVTVIIQVVIGVLAGALAAIYRDRFIDRLIQVSSVLVVAVPLLAIAFGLQFVFGLQLGWFPIAGISSGFTSYILPGLVLASVSTALVARLLRNSLVETLQSDYVRTATAKGLRRRRVVGRHAMRNAMIPVVTFIGADLATMIGGAIATETIFNIPGVGQEVFRAIQAQEGTVVVGIVTLLVLFFVVINLIVDIAYAFLDPRIRYE